MVARVLLLPGLGDSGPAHWQSLWQDTHGFARVIQRDWEHPVCRDWVESFDEFLAGAAADTVVAAHSLGCHVVAAWAAATGRRLRGALLVAPPDPTTPAFPPSIVGFSPLPRQQLAFPSIVVASSDDPWASVSFAAEFATDLGARFVDVGAGGHLNSDSGLGVWNEGFALLQSLRV